MCHTQKKKNFPTFCFFSKKMIFEKKIFYGKRQDTPNLRKFWKKKFFPNFCFFQKKIIFEKKKIMGHAQKNFFPNFCFFAKKIFSWKKFFFVGHADIPYLFEENFFLTFFDVWSPMSQMPIVAAHRGLPYFFWKKKLFFVLLFFSSFFFLFTTSITIVILYPTGIFIHCGA